jgi:MFS family permease
MRTYYLIILSFFISLLGTQVTDFALGVWVLNETNSAFLFSLIGFATLAPQLLAAPFLGILVDRFDFRTLILVGHSGAAIGTLSLAVLFFAERLDPWMIISIAAISSVFNGLLYTTITTCAVHMVPSKLLTKSQGALASAFALAQIASPPLAAYILEAHGQ